LLNAGVVCLLLLPTQVVAQQITAELQQRRASAEAEAAAHSSAANSSCSSSSSVTAQQQRLSHLCLLLYALSELGLNPSGRLLRSVCYLSMPLLCTMPAGDLAMLAVAFGRFGYVPPEAWRQAFLDVTAAAATATAAAAGSWQHGVAAAAAAGGVGSNAGMPRYSLATAAAAAALDAVFAAPAHDSSSSSSSSQQLLNPADVTSLLTAVHSMNLNPPKPWISSMMQAGLSQLSGFDLQQCVILLLAMHKLQVQPQAAWLLAVADRVQVLAGSSSNNVSSSWDTLSSSSSSSSSLDVVEEEVSVHAAVAAAAAGEVPASSSSSTPSSSSSSSSSDAGAGALNSLDEQRRRQQQWQQQMAHTAQPPPTAPAAATAQRIQHHPHAAKLYSKLCLYLWALSKVVSLLPEDDASLLRQQLKPAVAAAAKQLAAALPLLRPLDLVQLMLGLWQLQCRPGPGFMAAHMARCEAAHAGFSGSMYQELRRAYQGLGFQPSQSLMVLMYSKMGSQQQQQQQQH
jgi:hypothetical protein